MQTGLLSEFRAGVRSVTVYVSNLMSFSTVCRQVREFRAGVGKLLKRFPRYDQKLFMNIVTDDESWMHYFEPHRKISNREWLTKMQEGLVLSKGLPV